MTRVKVLTLNILHDLESWQGRAPLIVEGLVTLQPDIIGLQECLLRPDRAHWIAEQMNDRLSGPAYQVFQARKTGRLSRIEAIAVLTRLPVREQERLTLRSGNRVAQRVRVGLPDGHLLDFINTHLHHPPAEDALRVRQARRILDWLAKVNGADAIVLAGDFNATPDEKSVQMIQNNFLSVFKALNRPEPVTFGTPLAGLSAQPVPQKTIDYIFVSPNVRVLSAQRVFDRPHPDFPYLYPSDHFGLCAELEIP